MPECQISTPTRQHDALAVYPRRVQPIPGFVYGHIELVTRGTGLELQVYVRPRNGCRAACGGCGKKRPGYDTLEERRFSFVPLWGIIGLKGRGQCLPRPSTR